MRAFLWAANYQGKLSLQLVNKCLFLHIIVEKWVASHGGGSRGLIGFSDA
jgi:hypothetical protein